jgi:hypothetical protein
LAKDPTPSRFAEGRTADRFAEGRTPGRFAKGRTAGSLAEVTNPGNFGQAKSGVLSENRDSAGFTEGTAAASCTKNSKPGNLAEVATSGVRLKIPEPGNLPEVTGTASVPETIPCLNLHFSEHITHGIRGERHSVSSSAIAFNSIGAKIQAKTRGLEIRQGVPS